MLALQVCFWCAEYDVEIVNNSGLPKATRPFRVTFPAPQKSEQKGKKRKAGEAAGSEEQPATSRPKLMAESYAPQDPGPYPQDKPPENPVRFTPVQVGPFPPTVLSIYCLAGRLPPSPLPCPYFRLLWNKLGRSQQV